MAILCYVAGRVDATALNRHDQTPLDVACDSNHGDMATIFSVNNLQLAVDVSLRDVTSDAPLDLDVRGTIFFSNKTSSSTATVKYQCHASTPKFISVVPRPQMPVPISMKCQVFLQCCFDFSSMRFLKTREKLLLFN